MTSRDPGRPGAPGTPRAGLAALRLVLASAAVTAVLALVDAAPAAQRAAGLVLALAGTAFLLGSARASAAPSGWRWSAAVVAVTSAGGALAPLATGLPVGGVVGTLPGSLLAVVALHRLRDPGPWPGARTQLATTSALLAVSCVGTVRVVLHPLTDRPLPPLLAATVLLVPLAVALPTTAALLVAGTSTPARQRVAALLLAAQAVTACSTVLSVLAWGSGSADLQAWVRPAAAAAVVALCLACRADVPRGPGGDRRFGPTSATWSLVPHAVALPAGTLLLVDVGLTGRFHAFDAALAGTGLVVMVAHHIVMWRTQRRLTADLVRSESFFRTLVRSSADPVVILDDRLRVTFASRSLGELLGLPPAAVVGRSLAEAVHRDDAPSLLGALAAGVPDGGSAVRTARVRHADGRWRLIQATVRDLRGDPDVGALVLFCRDVPETAPVGPGLAELSRTDPVTGLPNRSAAVRHLAALRRGAAGSRPAALVLLGADGFDATAAGDAPAALRALTSRLAGALRTEDWLARTGEADFAVVVSGSVADAEVLASRLVAAVGSAGRSGIRASAGVTPVPDDVDPAEALRRGELALRSARAAGPGAVHRCDDPLRQERDRRAALRADLPGAVERGELRLVFQPVVDVVLHRTVSVEALLRWRHPVHGEVAPAEFVPLAEESGLICDLGRWALTEACATVAELPHLGVAVNVSARHVRSGSLVPDVLAALRGSGLPPGRLVVEITESLLLDDGPGLDDLAALRSCGVRVAVDDFGTGWSSLAYLVGLPLDVLKLDQQFLSGIEHDPQRQALCRSVLQLGSSLGLPVVVEGVTSATEMRLLQDMGSRYLQGYALSRPLEADRLGEGAWPTGLPARVAGPAPAAAGNAPSGPQRGRYWAGG